MQIPKPTDQDREYFRSLVPDDPRVEVKPMFGNLGAFVNGNMFMGLFGTDVGVKLADEDAVTLRKQNGAGPFGPAERPMSGYVALPAAWRKRPADAQRWAAVSLDFVASMPPKQPKKRSAKKR